MNTSERGTKLQTLPWYALYEIAVKNGIGEKEVNGKDKSIIIEKILSYGILSDDDIERYVNDYIYGDRVTFTLWTFQTALENADFKLICSLENIEQEYLDIHPKAYDLKGIIKKNSKKLPKKIVDDEEKIRTPLLSTSQEGQEIIRQFVEQGMLDIRCHIIAVIVPQYIDNGFKGTLRHLARLSGKKVTFIELDELCELISINKQIKVS